MAHLIAVFVVLALVAALLCASAAWQRSLIRAVDKLYNQQCPSASSQVAAEVRRVPLNSLRAFRVTIDFDRGAALTGGGSCRAMHVRLDADDDGKTFLSHASEMQRVQMAKESGERMYMIYMNALSVVTSVGITTDGTCASLGLEEPRDASLLPGGISTSTCSSMAFRGQRSALVWLYMV